MNEDLLNALRRRFPAHVDALSTLVPAFDAAEPLPFLLRYRADALGGVDEQTFRKLRQGWRDERELIRRRGATRRALEEAGPLSEEMGQRIDQTRDLALLEDLIRPVRERRRGGARISDPMTPVASGIVSGELTGSLDEILAPFCGKDGAAPTAADQRVRLLRLVADQLAADALRRFTVRQAVRKNGVLVTEAVAGKELKPAFAKAAGLRAPITQVRPRTLLLVRRGQKAGLVSAHVELTDEEQAALLDGLAVPAEHPHADLLREALADAFPRVLLPAASAEVINERKRVAERGLLAGFADALRDMLMAPAAGPVPVVAVAPGSSGSGRLLVVDAHGRPGATTAVHPLPPRGEKEEATRLLREMIAESGAKLVAVAGSGRASALRDWVGEVLAETPELGARLVPVSEGGARGLSEGDGATTEPELPASARVALSLGRYVQDPLSELAAYDLTRVSVGANQRDVDQGELRRALDEVAEYCIARVGTDVNSASVPRLARVPGLDAAAARAIVAQREALGVFATRNDVKGVPGISEEAWQRAGGFLRARPGADPLDVTGVHPTGADVARAVAEQLGAPLAELVGNEERLKAVDPASLAGPVHTLDDVRSVLDELGRGDYDPRGPFVVPAFNPGLKRLRDLEEGQALDGVVTGVSKFGAFVDVGLRQQGLVHVSQLSHEYVEDPTDVVTVGQRVRVQVVGIEPAKRRLSLSIKALQPAPPPSERPAARGAPYGAGDGAPGSRSSGRPGGARTPGGSARRGRPGGGERGGPGGRRPGRPGRGDGARGDRGGRRERPRQAPKLREIPLERDPFHQQLSALREQLGFAAPAPAAEKPKKAAKRTRRPKGGREAPSATPSASPSPSSAADATQQPAAAIPAAAAPLAAPAPESALQPTPEAPTPEAPTPETPTPEAPTPEAPTPEAPTPETPTPEAPTPEAPTPEAPTPEAPTPEAPTPEAPTPEAPTPEAPTPEAPTPEAPTPEAPTPEAPMPEAAAPEAAAPEAPTPETAAPEPAVEPASEAAAETAPQAPPEASVPAPAAPEPAGTETAPGAPMEPGTGAEPSSPEERSN